MADLNSIKNNARLMAHAALSMWQLTYDAFLKHDLELIAKALEEEDKLNKMQDEVSSALVSFAQAKLSAEEEVRAAIYADIAGDFELIGDYCKDILERVQVKIEEKLLFSEEAVEEFKELYNKTRTAMEEIVFVLDKDNPSLVSEVLRNEEHIDALVDKYRRNHNMRMLAGKCTALGCNMYLNMLDFSAAVYYHIKKIARSLLKVK